MSAPGTRGCGESLGGAEGVIAVLQQDMGVREAGPPLRRSGVGGTSDRWCGDWTGVWFSCQRRKTICVSKSMRMHDIVFGLLSTAMPLDGWCQHDHLHF